MSGNERGRGGYGRGGRGGERGGYRGGRSGSNFDGERKNYYKRKEIEEIKKDNRDAEARKLGKKLLNDEKLSTGKVFKFEKKEKNEEIKEDEFKKENLEFRQRVIEAENSQLDAFDDEINFVLQEIENTTQKRKREILGIS